jgi:Arc/MetJ family transcription regulator
MRTNIEVDEALIIRIRKATGLASKRSVVDAALRSYAAALEEEPGPASRALGGEMRRTEQARVLRSNASARVEAALKLGEEQLRLAAQHASITQTEARERHEVEKDRTRRKAV